MPNRAILVGGPRDTDEIESLTPLAAGIDVHVEHGEIARYELTDEVVRLRGKGFRVYRFRGVVAS